MMWDDRFVGVLLVTPFVLHFFGIYTLSDIMALLTVLGRWRWWIWWVDGCREGVVWVYELTVVGRAGVWEDVVLKVSGEV